MLSNSLACAAIPVSDLERARTFYGRILGLAQAEMGDRDEAFFAAQDGSMLHLYQRPSSSAAEGHTVVTFLVANLTVEMSLLRERGAQFEEYNEPELSTQSGIFSDESGFKAAWLKDPDGNVLSLEQLADAPSAAS